MPDFSAPLSALNAFDVSLQATVNNIANVNTDAYKSQLVQLESGPHDHGVMVGSIYRDLSPGPAVISNFSENDLRNAQDLTGRTIRGTQDNYSATQAHGSWSLQQNDTSAAHTVQDIRDNQEAMSRVRGYAEGSNVDLPREFAHLAVTETAHSANVVAIRTMEELTGSILNVKV